MYCDMSHESRDCTYFDIYLKKGSLVGGTHNFLQQGIMRARMFCARCL
jgi:hypothetical protein